MLFWIFVILMIIGIVLILAYEYGDCHVLGDIGASMTVLSFVVVAIMLVFIIAEHAGIDGYVASMNAKREALVWQLENDIYENDNDIGKYELMSEIREWNEGIVSGQALQDDFWVGIFHANVYDQFELIPLE